jgi:uncharacterized membrane protein
MDRWFHRILIGLAVLGLVVSIYMTIFKFTDNPGMCLGNGGCSVVNHSRYSEVSGVPVAILGVGGYAAILACLVLRPRVAWLRENGTMTVFGLALVGFLFTLYLVYVELALIRALCPFCVTSQVTMTVLFTISLIALAREPAG